MADEDLWYLAALDVPELSRRGLTGRGITVGVVDTGVRRDHPDLSGRNVRALDIRGDGFDGNDLDGHGTSMVGLIVGRQGPVAPEAAVVSIKALLAGPEGDVDQLVSGIQIALAHGVDVLSLSVGVPDVNSALGQVIQQAIGSGVLVVAAGDDADSNAPLYPAALTPVVSVTASNRNQGCLFNVFPAWLDVAAPGVELETLSLQGRAPSTGTSPATAVCAGVCALLLEIAPSARRRELAGHLLGFLSSTGQPPAGSTGPNVPKVVVPRAAAAAIDAWLAQ